MIIVRNEIKSSINIICRQTIWIILKRVAKYVFIITYHRPAPSYQRNRCGGSPEHSR